MIKEREYWKDSPYYNDGFASLYDFLHRPAGPALGKEVYKEAAYQRIPFGQKWISNPRYSGRILCYPITWLENYFGQKFEHKSKHKYGGLEDPDEESVILSLDDLEPVTIDNTELPF